MNRITRFVMVMGFSLILVYSVLPKITHSVGFLNNPSQFITEKGINPSNYYCTDVEKVMESEFYLRTVLKDE
ncbi:hypothetical protein [Desulfatibacillum alkenivorans]|uniref:hypothetical protein n=1 Tax=Desulfatibacillum alkenivorans TaxID=259354 RepID=UPI001114E031|nr:hypothetical protein [Desulfatibacillum alkenivorans]